MSAVLLAVGLFIVLVSGAPAHASEAGEATRLNVETEDRVRQGEPHEIGILLTDADGAPLAGQPVTVREQIRFFDYVDTVAVGEARTDHRGAATLEYTPTVPGPGGLTATFDGDATYAGAKASVEVRVAEGAAPATQVTPDRPEPLLPRGVTAFWFVPLLAGVWLAIAAAVYQLVRIPDAGRQPGDA